MDHLSATDHSPGRIGISINDHYIVVSNDDAKAFVEEIQALVSDE